MTAHVSSSPSLFDSLTIGSLHARNKLVRAATFQGLANEDGSISPRQVSACEELARGGVGTIITSFAFVCADGQVYPRMIDAANDALVNSAKPLVSVAHENGARIVLQLVHGGSACKINRECTIGPSPIVNPKSKNTPHAATAGDIERIRTAFVNAALRAQHAGFDGVEVHAAHGYLLSQFMSPALNERTDEYGGSEENRARFAVEIVEGIRAACGPDFPVLVKLNCDEAHVETARLLETAGASAIEVSGNWRSLHDEARQGTPLFAKEALVIANSVDIPVILTGGIRTLAATSELRAQGISGFGLARPLICEPDLALRWQSDPDYRARCISCDECSLSSEHDCILRTHTL